MRTSYKVSFWEIRPNVGGPRSRNAGKVISYTVRWLVAGREKSQTFKKSTPAKNFLSDLRQAAKNGEEFDIDSGLPLSKLPPKTEEKPARTWLEFSRSYIDMKWPDAAPNSRDGLTETIATVSPALVHEDASGAPDPELLRRALRAYYLAPQDREEPRPVGVAEALAWLEKASLPMPDVAKPTNVRAALNALSRLLNGKPAAASTVARKRAVLHNAFEYAVELEELDHNPIDKVKWTPPKLAEEVDWRVVIGPRLMRECLTAVTYVGKRGRGRRLRALYACMYYGALRPAEAVALHIEDCHLPATGWGRLVLCRSLPESGSRWTDSGSTHEQRGLKLRPLAEVRTVPIPPVLVQILRDHIAEFGTAEDGRIFQTERGGIVGSTAYGDVWAATRLLALTPAQVASPLARRPYDLRHAGVSLWLNSGVPATEVAERAGHSVKVLLQVYAKCILGQHDRANQRIDEALDD
ncbi:tyrosine-type recombinase/integrase [Actinomadura litoris]|uniref:Tyrosine-type recombinase/integrase n=1 Tax=Actinomadura litoris TaxID=2678616 RepID=A0A7K1LDB3_9ACTN|nr:site-specific integrase [Actinomadura litoris]MUN42421.1 tyrosine-type recombinase/integrase [Actinomadura litoris]